MRISNSKMDLYSLCSMKYKFKYLDKLEPDKTFTPLLFGSAFDEACNYILIETKNNRPVDPVKAKEILLQKMKLWNGQNELVFFKSEAPEDLSEDPEQAQWDVWNYLVELGYKFIDTYIAEILPLFDKIIDVQITKNIENSEGDSLIIIIDFIATLKSDPSKTITFDNKTSSNIKTAYGKSSVKKSQQLSLYAEFSETRTAGYLALQKKLVDGKVTWTIVTDEIPEETSNKTFEKVDACLVGIKNEVYEKNEKVCFSWGRKCEYFDLCKNGKIKGLIQK